MADYKQSAAAFDGIKSVYPGNMPTEYAASVQKQYMADRNKAFLARAKYASDFVSAEVQGLTDDFFVFCDENIRLSDAKSLSTISSRKTDDFKEMLIADPNIDYVPQGAKVNTMGSTFIVFNPYNLSGGLPKSLLVRCNAVYNSYDAYGNIVSEPLFIDKKRVLGSEDEFQRQNMLMHGYVGIVCQLNENTRKLGQNQRIILSDKAYHISGFDDFSREFTYDNGSVHLLYFDAYVEEPTEYDDLENHIANGKTFSFGGQIDGNANMRVGQTQTLTALFTVNGEEQEDLAQTWTYASSDEGVLTVEDAGNGQALVTPVSEGSAVIRAVLQENNAIVLNLPIDVQAAPDTYIEFIGALPQTIRQYDGAEIEAKLYINGEEAQNAVYTFTTSGADECYSAVNVSNGKLFVSCLRYSAEKLTVTVLGKEGTKTATTSAEISLVGY